MSTALFSRLAIVCPGCDQLNPAGASRCAACGAELFGPAEAALPAAPAAASQAIPPATPTSPAGIRRREIPVLGQQSAAALGQTPIPLKTKIQPAGTPFMLTVVAGPKKGERFRLAPHNVIGRTRGTLLVPEDPFVSPQHATLWVRDGRLHVRDEASASGVFVSVATQELVVPGGYFCAGDRLFRYLGALPPAAISPTGTIVYGAPLPPGGTCYLVEERLVGGRSGAAFVTAQPLISIGRKDCDISFRDDETLAPRHCELSPIADGAVLRDLSEGLGTLVRLQPGVERPVKLGEQIRVGQALMRFEAVEASR
jgi:pSer/pThr/pTyr-binding forkhead associated (FHA) protein